METSVVQRHSIEAITSFMKSVLSDFVDGYNQLDTPALLAEACKELGTNQAGAIPTEFELAVIDVERWYKEQ